MGESLGEWVYLNTRKTLLFRDIQEKNWSWREESNPRPADYKSAALPTELRQLSAKQAVDRMLAPFGVRIIPSADWLVKLR